FVVNEIVFGVRLVQQFNDFGIGIGQVFVEDAVLWIRAALRRNNEILAVVGDFGIKKPFFLVWPLVDQFVLRLRRAEPVEEKFVIVNLGAEFVFGFVVTTIEKSATVFFPRCVGELDPIQQILSISATLDIAHFPLLPIRTGGGQAISHQ